MPFLSGARPREWQTPPFTTAARMAAVVLGIRNAAAAQDSSRQDSMQAPRVWGRNGRDRAGPTRARSACVRACEIARTSSPRRSPTQRLEGAASLEPGAMRPRRRGRREPARAQGRAEPAVYERHGRSRAAGSAGASPQSGLRPSQGGVGGEAAPLESRHGALGRRDSDAPGPECRSRSPAQGAGPKGGGPPQAA